MSLDIRNLRNVRRLYVLNYYSIEINRHNITEVLLKVALNTIKQTKQTIYWNWWKQVQCSRISISLYPWQVNYGQGKMDFQTLVVCGQVNFNYWIEEFISNDFKLSLLHNCTNEESYFYLKSCFHTRSSSVVRGDLIV